MLPFVFLDPRAMLGIQPWGLCVVAGAWTGSYFAKRRALSLGYDAWLFSALVVWAVVTGFVLGHALDLAFYHPEVLLERPVYLLYLWRGQSSCGGFLGAIVGGIAWKHLDVSRRRPFVRIRPKPLELLPYTEVITATFPITWVFARLGCALVHDHPGRLVPAIGPASWLALAWPIGEGDGVHYVFGPLHVVWGSMHRYDMGLIELLFTLILAAGLATTWRRGLPMGAYTATVCLAYAPVRFALDFLRATDVPEADPRYAHLTFAQWFCLAMIAFGLALALRIRPEARRDRITAAP